MESTRHPGGNYFWEQQYNELLSDAQAASSLLAHQMLGYITLPNQPADGDTVTFTINGTAITLTAKTALSGVAGQVLRGGSAAAFAGNLIALAENPQFTTSNGVALTTANQQLLSYLGFTLVGTTLYIYSLNSSIWSPLTSFTASVSTAGDSYSAQTMQLFVEPGNYWLNGTRVSFAGGATPTVTAPVSNPRIDVLTIDSSGTLAWTVGTENASPSVPAYPANKIPLIELYNVVGETALYDNFNQQAGQGYINKDIRPFIQYPLNPTALATNLVPDSAGGRDLGTSGTPWGNVYAQNLFQNGVGVAAAKFGGTGADGALSISSGTTTLNLSNAFLTTKNYTSISITGTGKLAFSNPNANGSIIILKSQGNVTLTSSSAPMIDASAMGAPGGASVTSSSSRTSGNPGTAGITIFNKTNPGNGGNVSGNAGGAVSTFTPAVFSAIQKYGPYLFVGAGAGSGDSVKNASNNPSGVGGYGGGCLVIECGGSWNFTTSGGISVAGQNGGNGSLGGGSTNADAAGGGGGGGGGFFLGLYAALTANTGTVTVSGGTGGTGTDGGVVGENGGGGGGSFATAGNNGQLTGNHGSGSTTKDGGDGATGISVVAQNTEFS